MRAALAAALEQVGAPELALGRIQLQGVTLDAHVHGEALPRRFADVSAVSAARVGLPGWLSWQACLARLCTPAACCAPLVCADTSRAAQPARCWALWLQLS